MPHRPSPRGSARVLARVLVPGLGLALAASVAAPALGATAALTPGSAPRPDLGSSYLVAQLSPTARPSYVHNTEYDFTDFGLTVDVALALVTTGRQPQDLADVVDFVENGHDATGTDLDSGYLSLTTNTEYRSGGSLGKVVLLEKAVGHDPSRVGPHHWDLTRYLADSLCTAASPASTDPNLPPPCLAAGNYANTGTTFGQTLAVIAQQRAGQTTGADAGAAYLARQQQADGSFASDLTGLPVTAAAGDTDSTALAAMALDLLGRRSAADRALTWLTTHQEADGGFPGASGAGSTNSTGLVVQALTLRGSTYGAQIDAARGFLARYQDLRSASAAAGLGGYPVVKGDPKADLRASAQAVAGATGVSLGTLALDVPLPAPRPMPTSTPTTTPTPTPGSTPRPSSTPNSVPTPASTAGTSPRGSGGSPYGVAAPGPTATATTAPATATTTASATPTPSSATSSTTSAATTPSADQAPPTAVARTSADTSGGVNPLWWLVLAVALVLGALLVRTLRTRPARTPARHEGPRP